MELQGFAGVDECRQCGKDNHVYEWVTSSGSVHFYCPDCKPVAQGDTE